MNIPVEEFTSSAPVTISLNAPLSKCLKLMQENGIRHVPVMENSQVVGVLSERDLLANYGKTWSEHLLECGRRTGSQPA